MAGQRGKWSTFVRRAAGAKSQLAIAQRAGIDQATISRWLSDAERVPSAQSVVRFARAFNVSPLEALVAAGVITKAEAQLTTALTTVSSTALAAELTRRAESSAA